MSLLVYNEAGKVDPQETLFKSWKMRLKTFMDGGNPIPQTSGLEERFWGRFRFSPECRLFTSESHEHAADPSVMNGIVEVWNFDAHHDGGGYEESEVDDAKLNPGNWLFAYDARVSKHVRYPAWKVDAFELEPKPRAALDRAFDDGNAHELRFDRLFVCRSGQWTAPWIDGGYRSFLNRCPVALQHAWPLTPREAVEQRLLSVIERAAL